MLYLDGGWQSLVDQLRAPPRACGSTLAPPVAEPARCIGAVIVAAGRPDGHRSRCWDVTYRVGPPARISGIDYGLARRPPAAQRGDRRRPAVLLLQPLRRRRRWRQAGRATTPPPCSTSPPMTSRSPTRSSAFVASRRCSARRCRRCDGSLHELVTVSAMATPSSTGGLAGRPSRHRLRPARCVHRRRLGRRRRAIWPTPSWPAPRPLPAEALAVVDRAPTVGVTVNRWRP